ncbi:MAG: tetratricopeptide repeat protein [Lentisphaeria bacterium]|jgi:tetratricopeptide (TPR) repeat protein
MNQKPPPYQALRRTLFHGEILLLAALVAYLPSLGGGFSWDDALLVTDNPHLRSLGGLANLWLGRGVPDYFPLTLTSFWLEWQLWGDFAPGYRAVNLLLHALSAVALWRLLLRLKLPWAWLGALLYAVHPVCAASVAWISERKNTLAQLLAILAVLCFLRHETERRARDWWLALGCFLAALLAKTSVVTIPPAILLLLWWRERRWDWGWVRRLLPFFALAAALGLATIWFQTHQAMGGKAAAPFATRLAAAGWAEWFYLGKLLVPLRLAMVYPRWEINSASLVAWLPGLAFAALLAAAWWQRNRSPFCRNLFVILALHAGLLFPVLGFFGMAYQSIAWASDHLQYLAVPVAAAAVAAALEPLTHPKPMELHSAIPKPLPGLLVALPLAILTVNQAWLHGSQERLWREAVRLNPASHEARVNLGAAILNPLKAAAASALLPPQGSDATAGPLAPDAPEARVADEVMGILRPVARGRGELAEKANIQIAEALRIQGRLIDAILLLEEAAKLNPASDSAHCNLGVALEAVGRLAEAQAHYRETIRLAPRSADAHFNLGNLQFRQGQLAAAEASYQAALRLRPNHVDAMANYATLLAQQGRLPPAIAIYEAAIRQQPARAELHQNLGAAWLRAGDATEAERCFRTALDLKPGNAAAWGNLATALASQRRFASAFEAAQQASTLAPHDPAYDRLAILILGDAGQLAKACAKAQEVGQLHAGQPAHLLQAAAALRQAAGAGATPETLAVTHDLARQVQALFVRGAATRQEAAAAEALLPPRHTPN